MYESKSRSIAKAVTWRATATLTTIIIAYFITGEVTVALEIGGIELFVKMFIYYAHERLWSKVKYGCTPEMDYQI